MDPDPRPVPKRSSSQSGEKFYQEIATEMIGNALIIRVEKDPKKKMKKLLRSWDPPCDCEMVEIRRPGVEGGSAKIVNGGDNNQVLFKVYSKSKIPKDDGTYKPQAIAYKVGSCRGGKESNDQCRTITVHPQMGGLGSQEVHSDHVTDGSQDVFLLRIKKNPDTMDHKRRNIELELRTPRPPTPQPEPEIKIKEVVLVEENKKTKEVGKGKGKKGKGKKKK